MPRHVDALTSPTLKHLRERWWDTDFSDFLRETLRPRPGTRILDVGSGEGTAEVSLGRMQVSQVALFAVDRKLERARQTAAVGLAHNIKLKVAAADAHHLPFAGSSFDSTFCVGILQHTGNAEAVVSELARVTKPGGRILVVEPDNSARYWFSSLESGRRAHELAGRFFASVGQARGDGGDPAIGPKLPSLFSAAGLEPLQVNLFPVSVSRMGPPPEAVWQNRREALRLARERAGDHQDARTHAEAYGAALEQYARDAAAAGPGFVEIQNTMLFATVGQKAEE